MRRFQYFIDFDGTVRIDNKDDDYPAGNTPWPKLFGIFNSFCNIFFKHSQIIRLALFKTSRGSYFRDIGKIVFHRLSVRNFFAPFRRGLKRIDSGQRRAKQLQRPFFYDNRLAATGVGNFQIDAASQRIDGKIHPEVVNKVIRSIAVAIVNLSHTFHKRLPEQLNIVRTLKFGPPQLCTKNRIKTRAGSFSWELGIIFD